VDGKKLRVSEYKALMKNRREEMRQLWCQDGTQQVRAQIKYLGPSLLDLAPRLTPSLQPGVAALSREALQAAEIQHFEPPPTLSPASFLPASEARLGGPPAPELPLTRSLRPLGSPLQLPQLPQFSLTPLNIADTRDQFEGRDESRDSESPISDVEITS
jgi:hypothetical protein